MEGGVKGLRARLETGLVYGKPKSYRVGVQHCPRSGLALQARAHGAPQSVRPRRNTSPGVHGVV